MALKAIIHKAKVSYSDLDNNVYRDHELTLARHPSETEERMMIRLLAYVLNVPEDNDHGTLEFAKDMWEPDEPALVRRDHTGLLMHEVELGQPEEKRLVRACGRSKDVTVYTFGSAATVAAWWAGVSGRLAKVRNLTVWQIPAEQAEALGTLAGKTMDIQITLQDGVYFIGEGERSVELSLLRMFGGEE